MSQRCSGQPSPQVAGAAFADVDTAGRLIEDQGLGLGRQPFRKHDLLLIAARQRAHRLSRG